MRRRFFQKTKSLGAIALFLGGVLPAFLFAQFNTPTPAPAGIGSFASMAGLVSNLHDMASLDKASSIGFTWIRDNLYGTSDYAPWDQALKDYAARGLKANWILTEGPQDPTTIGSWARTTAAHFAGKGVRWEIMNEPEVFWPNGDFNQFMSQYNAFAKAIIPGVKAGDPSAQVAAISSAWFDPEMLTASFSAGALNGLTAISVHGYWLPGFTRDPVSKYGPNGKPEAIIDQLANWRAIKNQYGAGSLPDWDTEWGYQTPHLTGGGTAQAYLIVRHFIADWAAGFQMSCLYVSIGGDPGYSIFDQPAANQAITTLFAVVKGMTLVSYGIYNDETSLNAVRMTGAGKTVYAAWMSTGQKIVQLSAGSTAIDMLGNAITIPASGNITIDAANGPVYVTTVDANVAVTGVSVSPTSAAVNVGATQQLTATVLPSNATNKTVSWSSSNAAVATVNANGLVIGIAPGTATITVTTQDGSKTAASAITVSQGQGTTTTDDFNGPLASLWTWSAPVSGPTYSFTNSNLRIVVPNTNSYDSWNSVDNSPKLTRTDMGAGDWSIETKLNLATYTSGTSFHTGLTVKLGTNNYLFWGPYTGSSLMLEQSGIGNILSVGYT
ncbi:MAG: Ig-like domain-containing protein, partial [Chitinivibrionales bacterium]|nr:Ig-like domain-containing protein [Chitinivibrionales bacterium]